MKAQSAHRRGDDEQSQARGRRYLNEFLEILGSNYIDHESWVSSPDSEVEIWVIICIDCSSPLVV
jgi:hypothetical protein